MKEKKDKANVEAQLLSLLKRVLPTATPDPKLAGKIYEAVAQELQRASRVVSFEKFCHRVELPDLQPTSIASVESALAESFGEADITVKPNRKEQSLAVEVALPDGSQFSGQIKVGKPAKDEAEDGEPLPKFVPFPAAMPGDKELVWMLARRETLSPEEAGIALGRLEEDFWASKTGQKLIRDRVERSFPEFIARAPGGMLTEAGLKRHYKTPEPVKVLRRSTPRK
jgi:hypothetical protein